MPASCIAAVELLCGSEDPTLWQTLPATYADGKLSTGELSPIIWSADVLSERHAQTA